MILLGWKLTSPPRGRTRCDRSDTANGSSGERGDRKGDCRLPPTQTKPHASSLHLRPRPLRPSRSSGIERNRDWGSTEPLEVSEILVVYLIYFSSGTSERCHSEPRGLPVLRIPNVIGDVIDTSELKYLEVRRCGSTKIYSKKGRFTLCSDKR